MLAGMSNPAHDINDVRIEAVDEKYVVICGCGWRSEPHYVLTDAVTAWERHRGPMQRPGT